MEKLQHIVNGENMESVREKINILIDTFNDTFPVTRSYLDLEDKPAIDGKELLPESKMEDFEIPIVSLPNELDLQQLFINASKINAEIIAREVAKEEVKEAMQLQNIQIAPVLPSDNWEFLVYVMQPNGTLGLYKTKLKEIIDKAVAESNRHEASTEENTLIIEG